MLLNVPELAEYLRIHPSTVYRLLARRKDSSFNIGGDWGFNIEEIDRKTLWRTLKVLFYADLRASFQEAASTATRKSAPEALSFSYEHRRIRQ